MPCYVVIDPVVPEEIFKFCQSILLSPLGIEWDPSFEQTGIHFTKVCLEPSLVLNWPSGSGEDKNVKSLQIDGQKTIDNRRSEILT